MRISYHKVSIVCLILSVLSFSCRPPVQEMTGQKGDNVEQQFLEVNQYLRDIHQDHIEAFVCRVGWEMKVSSTGLWYFIDQKGTGSGVTENSRVTFAYSSKLLDGSFCYKATEEEPLTIAVGKGGIEAGVEEGLLLMSEGDSATFIIPPHLGHGNFGDRNKIPGNSVIIYKVRLLNVN